MSGMIALEGQPFQRVILIDLPSSLTKAHGCYRISSLRISTARLSRANIRRNQVTAKLKTLKKENSRRKMLLSLP
jgi:hypothetical protein